MRLVLDVQGSAADTADLRRWFVRQPELRGALVPPATQVPQPGTMGAVDHVLELLLQPGGMTAVVAAAVVAWLQNRRGSHTVTITRPDGTQVVVTAEKVRGLTAQGVSELAQRVAAALEEPLGRPGAAGGVADAVDEGRR
ncbi:MULTISPECIES: hypothetical protein [unclassified Streptomyces]|uniref:effector-associated constant component EACC1 n=1 Tax=unclassified Streptomyces TaxID=2593676 RepID=UPI000C27B2E2|nr:hypothetical protein [Streptomyces sp. CB01635]